MGCAAKFWSQRENAEVAERLFSQIEKENALEQEQPGKVRGRAGGDAPRSRLAIRPNPLLRGSLLFISQPLRSETVIRWFRHSPAGDDKRLA